MMQRRMEQLFRKTGGFVKGICHPAGQWRALQILPDRCADIVRKCAPEDRMNAMINSVPHALKRWPVSAPKETGGQNPPV